jgi:hypothetical protein
MLDDWGYVYFGIGTALAYAEVDLENHRRATGGAVAGHGTSTIDPDHPVAKFITDKCNEVLSYIGDRRQDLGAIPTNIEILKAKIITARKQKPHGLALYTNDILDDVRRIKNDFLVILSERYFYSLLPGDGKLYGRPALFGDLVAKKFPTASDDIRHAGNCLALGEPTACILHLDRAMEIATRRLARKLHVTLDAKDSWGMVLGKMTEPIRQMPDNTVVQKRRKEKWAECRTNLYHIKMAWRDPGAHGTTSYSDKDAHDIFKRVNDFMQQLATLF